MKREIETVRNIIITAIVAALLAFVIWTLAAAEGRTSPPELPTQVAPATSTAPPVEGTPDTATPVAPYPPPPGGPSSPPYPPPVDAYPAPYPGPVYLPFMAGESYP